MRSNSGRNLSLAIVWIKCCRRKIKYTILDKNMIEIANTTKYHSTHDEYNAHWCRKLGMDVKFYKWSGTGIR